MSNTQQVFREILFPDGTRVNYNFVQSRTISGDTITLNYASGSYSYSAPTGLGSFVLAQIDGFQSGLLVISIQPYFLKSIDQAPSPGFDITSATIDIRGTGFIAGMKLRFEDIGGGLDSNGYYMTCTLVDQTHMTAVYGGPGDGILTPAPVLVYLQDSNNNLSNVLSASNPSGTVITIP